MSKLEAAVADLEKLTPEGLGSGGGLHPPKTVSEGERRAILRRTSGSLSPEGAGELLRIIEEGCERIDERDW